MHRYPYLPCSDRIISSDQISSVPVRTWIPPGSAGGLQVDCEDRMPEIIRITTRGAVALITLLVFFSGTIAAGQTQAYLGSVVTLSGYSYTGTTVYLFLTGPNLPSNGVALDNINRLADQGGTTQVDVDGNGHWVYQWNTGAPGLDAGIYTVWVADGPADVSHLSGVDYSTISIILSEPFITAGTSGGSVPTSAPPQPGSMNLSSTPVGASVVVNTVYKGMTPLTVNSLEPGIYNVTFSRFGYAKLSTPVTVEAGSVSEVNATLVPLTGSLVVNTTPAGAHSRLTVRLPVSPRQRSRISGRGIIHSTSQKRDLSRRSCPC